jgi:hypothetical protein
MYNYLKKLYMKKINYILASSTAAVLLASAPLLASAHEGSVSAKASANASVHGDSNPGLHLGSLFHFGSDTGKGERDNDNDNDMDDAHEHMGSTTPPANGMHATVGVVTAITGSTFTITPVGHKATTTVSTNSATAFRANGQATTSGALEVGAHVALIGTSTSSSTISASVVSIFNQGLGFFKHFFHFGHNK